MGEEITLRQIADKEDRESHIVISNHSKTVMLYTNNSTVMSRLEGLGVKHHSEDIYNGGIYSRTYELDFKDMGQIVRVGLYK